MDVTDVGIVTEIRFLQSLKALLAIDVKLEWIITFLITDEHDFKAVPLAIDVKGLEILSTSLQPKKNPYSLMEEGIAELGIKVW
jgi:hypothetical protein